MSRSRSGAKVKRGGRIKVACCCLFILLGGFSPARSAVLRVPDQYATLWAACSAAAAGDVIELADGTYSGRGYKNVRITRSLTIRSASGNPSACVIDIQREDRAFVIAKREESPVAAAIQGVTIRRGCPDGEDSGGAVYVWDGVALTLHNCILIGNCAERGGAVFSRGTLDVSDCNFVNNQAGRLGGGAVYSQGEAHLSRSLFDGNSSFARGGAVRLEGRGAVFSDCRFTNNLASESGGAVDAESLLSSAPVFTRCRFSNNSARGGSGGGAVCLQAATARLTACVFKNNSGLGSAGVVRIDSAAAAFAHCRFQQNSSFSAGGAVSCDTDRRLSFSDCLFDENFSALDGGAIFFYSSLGVIQPVIESCVFTCNQAGMGATPDNGGAFAADRATVTVVNTLFKYNQAGLCGGAVSFSRAAGGRLTNCTFHGNSADENDESGGSGGALWCSIPLALPASRIQLVNCILWGDESPRAAEIKEAGRALMVTHSLIAGGHAGAGNLDSDPGFLFADDFHLAAGSPCIDAGDPAAAPGRDLDGFPRPLRCGVDIGAYEYCDIHYWRGFKLSSRWDWGLNWVENEMPDENCGVMILEGSDSYPEIMGLASRVGLLMISGGQLAIAAGGSLEVCGVGCDR